MLDKETSLDRPKDHRGEGSPEDLETANGQICEVTDSGRIELVINKLQTVLSKIANMILDSDEDDAVRRRQIAQISKLITEIDMHRANSSESTFLTHELYLLEELSNSGTSNVHTILSTVLEVYLSTRGRTCLYADTINGLSSHNEKIKFFLEIFHTQLLSFRNNPDQEKLLELGTMVSSIMRGFIKEDENAMGLAQEYWGCFILCRDFEAFLHLELLKCFDDQKFQLIAQFIERTQKLKVRYQ